MESIEKTNDRCGCRDCQQRSRRDFIELLGRQNQKTHQQRFRIRKTLKAKENLKRRYEFSDKHDVNSLKLGLNRTNLPFLFYFHISPKPKKTFTTKEYSLYFYQFA